MDNLILKLTISLSLLNPNSQAVHPITPEVCASVAGVLDNRGSCTFPKQSGGAEKVIAVPTITGCDIQAGNFVLLSLDKSCDVTLDSIAELRKPTFMERLKKLFQ